MQLANTHRFQTYTAALILLHSAVQRRLNGLALEQLEQQHFRYCIAILKFCGTVDGVAASLYEVLDTLGSQTFSLIPTDVHGDRQIDDDTRPPYNAEYLLRVPANAEPWLIDLSTQLFIMLNKPFGGPQSNLSQLEIRPGWAE